MSEIEAGTAVAVVDDTDERALVAQSEMTIEGLVGQQKLILQAMEAAMQEGVHYGSVPGVSKPSLLKPGAEMLNVLFRLAPTYEPQLTWHDDGHLTVFSKCKLVHIPTGLTVAEGEGICTTRESKYAWRDARVCPECGLPQVRHGKARGSKPGNWYCWQKMGGCGATWDLDSDQGRAFEKQTGRVPNPDLPDAYNTVLKMGDKRALVAASLNATGASALFTQDVEDSPIAAAAHEDQRQEQAREFDPRAGYVQGAPTGGWKAIAEALQAIDAQMPWGVWFEQSCNELFGHTDWRKGLDDQQSVSFGFAMANATAYLAESRGGREFPPPNRSEVQAAFAKVLDGQVIAGPSIDEFPMDPDEAALASESAEDSVVDAEAVEERESTTSAASDPSPEPEQPSLDDIPFGDAPSTPEAGAIERDNQ